MKMIKRIIAVVLLCAVALSSAGCVKLDELKARHAVWKDEDQTALEFNGETYKRLPYNSHFEIWTYAEHNVFVTTQEVPVLLAKQYGSRMQCSKDYTLLESEWYEDDRPLYYCRDDLYEDIVKQMAEGVSLDLMMYDFWSYKSGEDLSYTLTAEQKETVEAVLKTQPTSLGANGYNEDYSVWLYRSSQNYLFRELIGRISVLNGEYRIIINNDNEDVCYSVPQELKAVFDEITKAYQETPIIYY